MVKCAVGISRAMWIRCFRRDGFQTRSYEYSSPESIHVQWSA